MTQQISCAAQDRLDQGVRSVSSPEVLLHRAARARLDQGVRSVSSPEVLPPTVITSSALLTSARVGAGHYAMSKENTVLLIPGGDVRS